MTTPGQEQEGVGGGLHEEGEDESEASDALHSENPDEGPAMSGAGAQPGGSSMNHWTTASPNTDATNPESMPNTKSTPMPGETVDRKPV